MELALLQVIPFFAAALCQFLAQKKMLDKKYSKQNKKVYIGMSDSLRLLTGKGTSLNHVHFTPPKKSSATDILLPCCDGQKKQVSIVTRGWSKGRGCAVAMSQAEPLHFLRHHIR